MKTKIAVAALFCMTISYTNAANAEYQANLNLLCRPIIKKVIQHDTNSDVFQVFDITDVKENGDIHRFKGNKLYLTSSSTPGGEYFYNVVNSLDDVVNGYKSGHKTIEFNSDNSHAVVTHAGPGSTEVYTIKCSKTAD